MARVRGYFSTRGKSYTMTKPVYDALYQYQRAHPSKTPTQFRKWLLQNHHVDIPEGILSLILARMNLPPTETGEEDEEMEDESDSDVQEEMEDESDNEMLEFPDLDLFTCPVCSGPLSIPVYQCRNGHVACSSCCLKIANKCRSCSLNIGPYRCSYVETVLRSISVSCKNRKYGCEEKLRYGIKNKHEEVCPLSPCFCPVPECNFKGSYAALSSHFTDSHAMKTLAYNKYNPITLERTHRPLILCGADKSIFVAKKFSVDKGSAISVVRIAPGHCDRLGYRIKAKRGTIRLKSSVENIPKWEGCHPERNPVFLPLLPENCTNSRGQLHLEICILKSSGVR